MVFSSWLSLLSQASSLEGRHSTFLPDTPLRGKFVRSPGKQWSSKRKFNLVNIAPAPVLSGLKGLDNRVVGGMEMLGRVLILGGVTAAHMTTAETEAQVNPGITDFQTFLAAVGTRGDLSDLVEMCTVFCHQSFHSFHPGQR
jgi:hypothetical protein